MTGMHFVGVEPRARDAKSALNRLRWEVDYAIEQGKLNDLVNDNIAEAVGIFTNILVALEQALPDEPADAVAALFGAPRTRFILLMKHYIAYHKVGR